MVKSKKKSAHRSRSHQKSKKKSSQSIFIKTGILDLTSQGYGFVILDDKSSKDVFIPAFALNGAMDRDQVEVSIYDDKRKRPEGKITQILKRQHSQVVGTFHSKEKKYFVSVKSPKSEFDIEISSEKTLKASEGQSVLVKIIRYPEENKNAFGEVIQLLGDREKPDTEIQVIIAQFQLRQSFPEEVEIEAKKYRDHISKDEKAKRVDLTHLPIVTIDGETAKDFDDGVYVERISTGFKLYVAIADVSHYVFPQTALDDEAYQRATSVYFPGFCIPMLPEHLSNGLCSLVPKKERLSFVAEIHFDERGIPMTSRFYKAVIKSTERLTYTAVHQMLVLKDEKIRKKYYSLLPPLETAFDLFLQLRERRLERGSIDFDLPEPQIVLDIEEGIATSIVKTSRNQAHMLIEEFMIAANEAVATFAADQEWPMIYRIHDFPDSEKIADFKNLAHGLGYALPPIDRLTPKHLASIVKEVQGKPHERLVNTLLLRSLKQAVYSPHNVGHFGLASEKYTHFTSPIRRYPDLIVHRRLHELLQNSSKTSKKKDHAITMQKLESMADHCSKMERNAMKAEWAVRDLHVALFMKDKVGEEYEGIISSVTKFGIFVEINDFFVEGLVPLYTILDDHYEFLEKHHELLGKKTKKRFKIGDAVKIRVVKSDIIMRRVEFEFVR